MTIINKGTPAKNFDEVHIGTVFRFPVNRHICMKINPTNCYSNAIDLEDYNIFTVAPNAQICELNAHLVIEGR